MQTSGVGAARKRVDGREKVTGRARYAADHALDGLVFGSGVHATIASGRLLTLDDTVARAMPGVRAVLHHGNVRGMHRVAKAPWNGSDSTLSRIDEHRLPFEDVTVYYPGQYLALVLADTFEQARAAALEVVVTYEQTRVVPHIDASVAQGLLQETRANHSRGDADEAFKQSGNGIERLYRTAVEVHNPMEMHSTTAFWQGDRLTINESTQGVINQRNVMCEVFNLAPEQVEVHAPYVGSGFGGKAYPWPHSIAACYASRVLGRPVQVVVPRAHMFTSVGHRPETLQRLKLSVGADLKLTSLIHDTVSSTSMLEQYVERCGRMTQGLYSCPNVSVVHRCAQVNRGTPTTMRAPGATPGLFALESAMDELAVHLGVDPLALRLANVSTHDESQGLPWSSNHVVEAMQTAGKRFGWAARNPAIGSMRDGDEVIGYGMAISNWEALRVASSARVTLRSDGTVLAQCGSQDIGTGTNTIAAQTVSEVLGIPLERVSVQLGDSSLPAGPLSGGSWVTASVMPALAEAARTALGKLRQQAVDNQSSVFHGIPLDALTYRDGLLSHAGREVPFEQVMQSLRMGRCEGVHRSAGMDESDHAFRSFGAHFVEVRWDAGISRLRVMRVVSAMDVGRIVNPITARNQVEGSIVMGLGEALFEAAEFDARSGMPTNNNFAEYMVPIHADMPEIDVILLDYPDYKLNEFGVRGIGEVALTGFSAAVANAVHHATGKRIRQLPITLDKLMDVS